MSFLIDPPWLYATGRAYGTAAPDDLQGARAAALGAATMAVFWGVSVSLYLDRPWTEPIWRACRARSGRDWMLNSGVLRLPYRRVGTGTHAFSALQFATYPVWLWLGHRHGRRRRRRC
jgi:hypothetical protein